jgi:ABC-2 type transport system ATP-binding protein
MAILELSDVHKSFRAGFLGYRNRVLKGLDLTVARGEVYGFLGHNGAGKSTTMKLILGLIRADAGSIQVFGSEGATRENRSRIGYLSEEIGLYPHLNAEENLRLVGELCRIPRRDLRRRIEDLLGMVGLSDKSHMRVRHYSKGMRQRLGVASAIINDPDLLLLDEPYSGLDPVGRRDLRELLTRLKNEGRTIVLSSHIVPDVEAVCDRVGIMADGRISRVLDLRDVYAERRNDVEVILSGLDETALDARDYGGEFVQHDRGVTIIRCAGDSRFRALVDDAYNAGGSVVSVTQVRLNLEEIFVEEIAKSPSVRTHDRIGAEEPVHS